MTKPDLAKIIYYAVYAIVGGVAAMMFLSLVLIFAAFHPANGVVPMCIAILYAAFSAIFFVCTIEKVLHAHE